LNPIRRRLAIEPHLRGFVSRFEKQDPIAGPPVL